MTKQPNQLADHGKRRRWWFFGGRCTLGPPRRWPHSRVWPHHPMKRWTRIANRPKMHSPRSNRCCMWRKGTQLVKTFNQVRSHQSKRQTYPGAVNWLKYDMFSVSGQLELSGELVELDSESDRISFNGRRSAVLQIFAVWSALVVANSVESGLNLHFKPYFLCALSFNFLCTGSIWVGRKS